jgi:hypothetical protein
MRLALWHARQAAFGERRVSKVGHRELYQVNGTYAKGQTTSETTIQRLRLLPFPWICLLGSSQSLQRRERTSAVLRSLSWSLQLLLQDIDDGRSRVSSGPSEVYLARLYLK